jgi:hypothetical protein
MSIRPNLALIFLRLRYGLLALLCIAFVAGFARHRPTWILDGAVLAGAIVAMIQFRYLRLALVVALAPLPGLLWFASSYYSLYPLALALAVLMVSGLALRLLKGSTEEVAFAALFGPVPGLIAAVLVALTWSLWGPAHFDGLVATFLSVLLAMPAGAIFLPFGERFHMAANRAREAREPVTLAAAGLVQPRWAFSLCGITAVFLVLAIFRQTGEPAPLDWICCILVAVALHAATLDWRAAIAGLIASSLLLLYGQGMTEALLLFVLLALFVAGPPVRGRDAVPVWALAIEDRAVPAFFAGIGAALTAALLDTPLQGLLALLALAAALLAFPALTVALHVILPRRRSVEELYRD